MKSGLKAKAYETDKSSEYLEKYEEYFRHLTGSKINLLELGVDKGGSLLMWRDYFKKGIIVGLDIEPVTIDTSLTDRIHIYQGFQQDKELLDKIREENAVDGFDIIIDDASHIGELSSISFWHLFNKSLKPGGVYVIEDWRTGYWEKWPDGKQYDFNNIDVFEKIRLYTNTLLDRWKNTDRNRNKISKHRIRSHDYGMVGFVKQLIDELGMSMITNPERGSKVPFRASKFQKMEIYPGLVFITKAK